MSSNIPVPVSMDALAVGRASTGSFITVLSMREPTPSDVNYPVGQRWYNTNANHEFILTGFTIMGEVKSAIWQPTGEGAASTETLTGNTGGAVGVDIHNNINVVGDGTTVNVAGNPGTNTLTISAVTGTVITETLTGNTGGAVSPTAGNINVVGDGTTIVISGNPGTSTLTATAGGEIATTYDGNTGAGAHPSGGILNIIGSGGIMTNASGDTVTISSAEAGISWQTVSVNTALVKGNGYICISPGGTLNMTLPAVSAIGDTIDIILQGATGWTLVQPNAGSQIFIGKTMSTMGTGGSVSSSAQGDAIQLVCTSTNANWTAFTLVGNLTIV